MGDAGEDDHIGNSIGQIVEDFAAQTGLAGRHGDQIASAWMWYRKQSFTAYAAVARKTAAMGRRELGWQVVVAGTDPLRIGQDFLTAAWL